MVHADGPVRLDGVAVCFDDERAVADAGMVLTATLTGRLGIEALVERSVDLADRPGAANPGAKVILGVGDGDGRGLLDDCDILRPGRTGEILGHQVAAPSTLGNAAWTVIAHPLLSRSGLQGRRRGAADHRGDRRDLGGLPLRDRGGR